MAPGPAKQFDPDVALDKAVDVFRARGFEAASLAELLGEMGIGRKSLYDTFGSKRELFLKALDRYAAIQIAALREGLARRGSPIANLRRVMQEWRRIHAAPGSHGCLFGTSIADFDTTDAEIAGRLRAHLGEVEGVLRGGLERARDAGELTGDASPRDLARLLVCVSQGLALVGRVLDGGPIPKSAIAAADALLSER